jgi:site-specific DNA recombinase
MRVLGRLRISRLTEESTSIERQREIVETWAQQNDHQIVGWAVDDVSGSVDPFETPQLGEWLNKRPSDFDVIACWKLDRIGRNAIKLNKLFGWCLDNDKIVVSATEGIDLSTGVGRLIANVIAFLAEGEWDAISERATGSHDKLRRLGRWPGGRPAYGYRAQEREDGAGWQLVHDEHSSEVLFSIIEKVLAGQSIESIARGLEDAGELTPADCVRQRAGEPVREYPHDFIGPLPEGKRRRGTWNAQSIFRLLRSNTLLGHVTHNGVTVRDLQSDPVLKGDPLIDREQFDRLQAVLDARSFTKSRTTKASPLLGVAVCKQCEKSLHYRRQKAGGKDYAYYYCPNKHGQHIPAAELEAQAAEDFLDKLRDVEVQLRELVPAESHQSELEEKLRAVDEISAALSTVRAETVRSRLLAQLGVLDSKISELEKLPTREARYQYVGTGQTYGAAWDAADVEDRRQLLLRSGITMAFLVEHRGRKAGEGGVWYGNIHIPDDIVGRMSAT